VVAKNLKDAKGRTGEEDTQTKRARRKEGGQRHKTIKNNNGEEKEIEAWKGKTNVSKDGRGLVWGGDSSGKGNGGTGESSRSVLCGSNN